MLPDAYSIKITTPDFNQDTLHQDNLDHQDMGSDNPVVDKTLSLLDNVELPYPGGPLLASFITEALNPIDAAHYLNERLSTDEPSSILSDWAYIIQCSMGFAKQINCSC